MTRVPKWGLTRDLRHTRKRKDSYVKTKSGRTVGKGPDKVDQRNGNHRSGKRCQCKEKNILEKYCKRSLQIIGVRKQKGE